MKSKKLLLGILIGISTLFIAAEYGRMEVNGLLKVDTIQHNKNASGVYIENIQMLNNTVRANAFYVGETELTPGGSTTPVSPIFISMLTKVPDAIGQGTWDIVIQSGAYGQIYHASFRNALAASSGDNFTVNFSVPAGTYRIDFNAVKGANMGILDVFVDAVKVLDAYDLYTATPTVLNIASITGVSLTAGSHALKFAINGKNASSSSYVINMSAIQISRTGD
jgi:hypothetical protein